MASALGRAGRAFVNVAAELTNRLDTFSGGHRQFGYDATEDRGRRRQITSPEKHEDCIAPERTRKILSQNSRDLARNFVIAQRAVRRHLHYTTCFSAQGLE